MNADKLTGEKKPGQEISSQLFTRITSTRAFSSVARKCLGADEFRDSEAANVLAVFADWARGALKLAK